MWIIDTHNNADRLSIRFKDCAIHVYRCVLKDCEELIGVLLRAAPEDCLNVANPQMCPLLAWSMAQKSMDLFCGCEGFPRRPLNCVAQDMDFLRSIDCRRKSTLPKAE